MKEDLTDAFYRLYEREFSLVLRYLQAGSADAFVGQDLCAEAFCRAWDAWPRFRGDDAAARAWIMRIARNALIDHLRHRRHARLVPLDEAGQQSAPRHEDWTLLRQSLSQLSTDDRDLLGLRLAGLSHAEIGKLRGRSEAGVRKAWQRALERARAATEVSR